MLWGKNFEERSDDGIRRVAKPPLALVIKAGRAAPSVKPAPLGLTAQGEPDAGIAGVAAVKRKVALLVTHGMGQQVQFETLDGVAAGLAAAARRQGRLVDELRARTVRVDAQAAGISDKKLQRVEMDLIDARGAELEVHIYEGYWAPITEGEVRIFDVMAFLIRGGFNGLRNAQQAFRRWMFGGVVKFGIDSDRPTMALVNALAVIFSLIVMNAIIAMVAMVRLLNPQTWSNSPQTWPIEGVFNNLTGLVGVYSLCTLAYFTFLFILNQWSTGHPQRCRSEAWHGLNELAQALLLSWVGLTAWCALTMALLVLPSGCMRDLSEPVAGIALMGAVVFAAFLVVGAVLRPIAPPVAAKFAACLPFIWLLLAALTIFGAVFIPLSCIAPESLSVSWLSERWWAVWMALFAVSALVRRILVQFPGDVAAYIASHTLDRFDEIRKRIKTLIYETALALYASRPPDADHFEYDQVALIGHSLGSLISYDTLNALINDDALKGEPLAVVDRTRLLLTLGCPLDKTAFVFATQWTHTTVTREALAATLQPLILDYQQYRSRLKWINVWSPHDLFSGELRFYDDASQPDYALCKVQNVPDEEALIPLFSHTEYWRNRTLFDRLYAAL